MSQRAINIDIGDIALGITSRATNIPWKAEESLVGCMSFVMASTLERALLWENILCRHRASNESSMKCVGVTQR